MTVTRRASVNHPCPDASCSGRSDTLPAAVLDGDPATGWSNAFTKAATALLPAFGGARPEDWISFTVDATHSLPASVEVDVWDGERYVPVTGAVVDRATASDAPTVVTFDPVRGSRLRLTLTSGAPGEVRGAVRISGLEA